MPLTSWLGSLQKGLRRLPGRTPLRVKMIAALLALVIIALTIISVASLSQFSGYLQNQSGIQVSNLFAGRMDALNASRNPTNFGPGWHGLSTGDFGYYGPLMVELLDTKGQVFESFGPSSQYGPGPAVPVSGSWLQANSGKLVTVPGQDGNASWQVMVKETTVSLTNPFTDQISAPQTVILVAGTSLANIDSTVGWLRRIDLLVSVIIVLALVVVGIAIVRASLRPLTDIEETAEAIAAGDLSRRVPDWDPRTEVGRLGRSLNTMLSQIESSFEARARSEAAARRSEERMRQFVADASHELRTPLTAMRGYAEYYRQRGGVQDDDAGPATNGTGQGGGGRLSREDLDRIMQRVEQEASRMGVLVEEMLLLARLDQQRPIERRPVDLLTLAADAVQDARIIAPSRKIELSVGSGAAFLVLGDEVRLRQVIGNLMSNALNHTPDGTPIQVRVLAGPRRPVPSAVVEVTDHGPGLRPDEADRVFERFYRADQARTRRGRRIRPRPGHRGRAGRGARRHGHPGHHAGPGRHVPRHASARPGGAERRVRPVSRR